MKALLPLFLLPLAAYSQSIHMWAGATSITDANNTTWSPNTCQNTLLFSNPGTYPSPIYTQAAYSPNQQTSITCNFTVAQGVYTVDVHLIEPVKIFNAAGKRIFSIFANGHPLTNNVDIFQQAGAVEKPLNVTGLIVSGMNGISITFNSSESSAIFSGIELCPMALSSVSKVSVNGVPIGTATNLNIASGNGISCQATVNAPVGTVTVQCSLSAAPTPGVPGFLYTDGTGNFLWAPFASPQSPGQSGILTTLNSATGAVGIAVNPTVVPFLALQNTFSTFTGGLNDFSASNFMHPGSRGETQQDCGQTLRGTDWFTPGNGSTISDVYQICQNQGGVFQWVTH